jgi:hypothetical protein
MTDSSVRGLTSACSKYTCSNTTSTRAPGTPVDIVSLRAYLGRPLVHPRTLMIVLEMAQLVYRMSVHSLLGTFTIVILGQPKAGSCLTKRSLGTS